MAQKSEEKPSSTQASAGKSADKSEGKETKNKILEETIGALKEKFGSGHAPRALPARPDISSGLRGEGVIFIFAGLLITLFGIPSLRPALAHGTCLGNVGFNICVTRAEKTATHLEVDWHIDDAFPDNNNLLGLRVFVGATDNMPIGANADFASDWANAGANFPAALHKDLDGNPNSGAQVTTWKGAASTCGSEFTPRSEYSIGTTYTTRFPQIWRWDGGTTGNMITAVDVAAGVDKLFITAWRIVSPSCDQFEQSLISPTFAGGSIPITQVAPPQIEMAVILAEPSDVFHNTTALVAQPCKLLPPKTYPNGHSRGYFEDLLYCVRDYHMENSFGKVDLNFTIFDNNGVWFRLATSTSAYVDDERLFVRDAIVTTGLTLDGYDAVAVIHAGEAARTRDQVSTHLETVTWPPVNQPLGSPPFKFLIAEGDPLGAWAHETGHILGELLIPAPNGTMIPDLSKMGLAGTIEFSGQPFEITNEGQWDLMALGSWNKDGADPPYMSSYTKEFLGWLRYDIHPKSADGEYLINSLTTAKLGDLVFRYNLEDSTDPLVRKYYILEARNRSLRTWDSSLPEDRALVLYKVDSRGFSKYGYDSVGRIINENWRINIPFFNGVLTPNGEARFDMADLVKITAISDVLVDNIYQVKSKIDPLIPTSFTNQLRGAVLELNSNLIQRVHAASPPALFNALRPMRLSELDAPTVAKLLTSFFKGEAGITEYYRFYTFGAGFPVLLLIGFLLLILRKLGRQNERVGRIQASVKEFLRPNYAQLLLFVLFASLSITFFKNFPLRVYTDLSDEPDFVFSTATRYTEIFYILNPALNILFWYVIACVFLSVIRRYKGQKVVLLIIALLTFVSIGDGLPRLDVGGTGRYRVTVPVPITSSIPSLDLDLHAYAADGRHIGVNYQTGEYEIQIPEAITSGDIIGGEEWIFVPADMEVRYAVSSKDNQQFLQNNPELAQLLTDATDTYNVYARFIDPTTNIFTSQTLTNQAINPGENIVHVLSGTSDISVSAGVVDSQAPVITHTPIQAEYILNASSTAFHFSADDGGGAGVKTPSATLDSQPLLTGDIINFTVPGTHIIEIRAEDFVGNTATKSIKFDVIYQFGGFLPPVKPDGSGIYKRGRTLPVKFQLTDADNTFISSATTTLSIAKVQDGIVGTEEIPLSTSAADTGNQFRYDPVSNQYIFNLSTDTMSLGTWQLKAVLDDGKSYTVVISIK